MTLVAHLQFEPISSEVEKLNRWLDESFAEAGTNERTASDLKLCINEAVANLISYAYAGVASPFFIVNLELESTRGKAVLLDNGQAFDFRQWPDPIKPSSIDVAKPGGFGIYLIKQRARAIDYEISEGLNKLTIECGASQ